MGDEIEVRPGVVSKNSEGKTRCRTIFSKIISLYAEHNDLKFAVPGGLIGKFVVEFVLEDYVSNLSIVLSLCGRCWNKD